MKQIIASILLLATLNYTIASCAKDNQNPLSSKENSYSGEEIFRGIYFGQGRLPDAVEALKPTKAAYNIAKGNPDEKQVYDEFVDEIVYQINQIDPEYFDDLKSQLQSSNFYTMEITLNNGRKMIRAAGYKSEKLAGLFKLDEEFQKKKVDFNAPELASLDLTKSEDRDKLDLILLEQYGIDTKSAEYGSGVAFALVLAVALAALGVVAYAVSAVYNQVEFWGKGEDTNSIGTRDVLIKELSHIL